MRIFYSLINISRSSYSSLSLAVVIQIAIIITTSLQLQSVDGELHLNREVSLSDVAGFLRQLPVQLASQLTAIHPILISRGTGIYACINSYPQLPAFLGLKYALTRHHILNALGVADADHWNTVGHYI